MGESQHDITSRAGWRFRLRLFLVVALLLVVVPLGVWTWRGWSPFGGDSVDPLPTVPAGPAPTVTATPNGDWPADVIPTPYVVPARVKNTLAVRGEQHGYLFTGTAGQQWTLTVAPWGSTLDPLVIVYDPDGRILARADDQPGGGFTASLVIEGLPATGTYRVLVRSSQGGHTTGAYILTLLVR